MIGGPSPRFAKMSDYWTQATDAYDAPAMSDVNWELLVQAVIGLAAVAIAVAAWLTSAQALRSTYRPLLRPVPLREAGKPVSLGLNGRNHRWTTSLSSAMR